MDKIFDNKILSELTKTQEELETSKQLIQELEDAHEAAVAEKNRKLRVLGTRVKLYRAEIAELTEACEKLRQEATAVAEATDEESWNE